GPASSPILQTPALFSAMIGEAFSILRMPSVPRQKWSWNAGANIAPRAFQLPVAKRVKCSPLDGRWSLPVWQEMTNISKVWTKKLGNALRRWYAFRYLKPATVWAWFKY